MIGNRVFLSILWMLVFILSLPAPVCAQEDLPVPAPGLYMPELRDARPSFLPLPLMPRLYGFRDFANTTESLRTHPQPRAYQFKELALFCKIEVKMEKALRIPIRMRLGDVPYVDWMEGKRKNY